MSGPRKNPSFIRYLKRSIGIIPLALILLSSTFGAGHASAGVFSLFSTALGKTQPENTTSIQRMKILEVAMSPDLNGRGGPDVITDESALISNDTPLTADVPIVDIPDVPVHQVKSAIATYKVKSGDTISSIADSFGISVNTIVWANNLDRAGKLTIGKTLAILPVSGITYTVRRGDTIDGIAKKYSAETRDIRDFNDKTKGSLIVGEKIIIPGAELSVSAQPEIALKVEVKATTTTETSPTVDEKQDDGGDALVFGTLMRPKTNKGNSSDFVSPITSGAGRKSQGLHDTWAVDIAAPMGTPIHATSAGTVIFMKPAGYNGGYGKYVAIEHEGGVQTLYAHMSQTKVEVGDTVSQDEVIGLVGSTGRSTGPHVHYEVRGAPNNCIAGCN